MLIDKEELKQIVSKYSAKPVSPMKITNDTDLILDLQYKEDNLVQLILAIEEFYKIEINICARDKDFPLLFSYLIALIENGIQGNEFVNMSEYAEQRVNYYKESNTENIAILPSDLFRNDVQILSQDYLLSFLSGELLHYLFVNSLGEFIFCTISLLERSIVEKNQWKLRNKWYGINFNDKHLEFHAYAYQGNRLCKNSKIIAEKNTLSIDIREITQGKIKDMFGLIEEFSPVWISANPSVIHIMVEYMKGNEIKIDGIRYIELFGEDNEELLENEINMVFPNAKIAKAIYTPMGMIALEDPNHIIKIISQNVVMNIKDNKLVISHNQVLSSPIINFYTDIKGNYIKDNEELENVIQRSYNFVILPTEGFASPRIFEYPLLKVNEEFNNPVIKFQIIQNAIDSFTLVIEIKKAFYGWEKSIAEAFLEEVSNIVDRKYWSISFVKNMSNCEYTGVYSYFYNNI